MSQHAEHAGPTNPDAPNMDVETHVMMRTWMRPILERAKSWPGLLTALSSRGYGLSFYKGRLWLTQAETKRRICTMRQLGAGMSDLSSRLGRPTVRPVLGKPNWGEFRV